MDIIKKWLGNFLKRISKKDQPIKKSSEINNKQDKETSKPKSLFVRKKRRPNFFLSVFVTTLRLFLILFILIGLLDLGCGRVVAYLIQLPNLMLSKFRIKVKPLYMINMEILSPSITGMRIIWLPLTRFPRLEECLIAIEDARFQCSCVL